MSDIVRTTLTNFLNQLSIYHIDDPVNTHIIQLGINPEIEEESILVFNITPFLEYYKFKFTNDLNSNLEIVLENIITIVKELLQIINSNRDNNGIWQGSAENVHDSTVNLSLEQSYNKIKNSIINFKYF